MKYLTLWRAGVRTHKGSLVGVFLLLLFISLSLGTVLTLWNNSERYIRSEMKRTGFGDLTAWVHDVPEQTGLEDAVAGLEAVERVERQRVIYADYKVKEQESDSQGQLIPLAVDEERYRFFLDDLSGYQEKKTEIASGEIYVSPSMVSMFGLHIGDEINFAVARSGGNFSFRIKGFYEDPFMGSSMIGMKGFLVCEADWKEIQQTIQERGKNSLAS